MNNFLVLDFETKDPYLSSDIDLGPGWCYILNNPQALARAIGVSILVIDNDKVLKPTYYNLDIAGEHTRDSLKVIYDNISIVKELVGRYKYIVMHNAQYDLGYLLTLGIDISPIVIYDTKIMAQLFDNTQPSTSLDYLSALYLKDKADRKDKNILVEVVAKHKLIKMKPTCKTFPVRAKKFAYGNMDLIQELDFNAMARYANQDTIATGQLFLKFKETIALGTANYWSSIQKACVKIRTRGVSIDMDVCHQGIAELEKDRDRLERDLATHERTAGANDLTSIVLSSPKKLAAYLQDIGYKLPRTKTGGPSTGAELFEQNPKDEFIQLIAEYRGVNKILNDFFIKTRDAQIFTCPEAAHGGRIGRLFPQLNLFGAITGRFSSSNPNIQNIPKRNKKYGALCRSMFIPNCETSKFYSLDWSNQEGRIATHFAVLIGAKGADKIAAAWHKNPMMDLHQKVADLIGYDRTSAKAVNLGLIYSKGEASLAKELGLPTEWTINFKGKRQETGGPELKALLAKYHKLNPWLKELNIKAKESMAKNGAIKTLGGRVSRREHPRYDYKALNKLVQGSAADQMYAALLEADKQGVDIIAIVHDEFCVEGLESAIKMKHIMETVVQLEVPMPAEVKEGTSWGTLTKLKDQSNAKKQKN